MMNFMDELNTLVEENTAFRNYYDLAAAIIVRGYTPTLREDRPGPRALGLALEARGHQVRWLDGSFWGYS